MEDATMGRPKKKDRKESPTTISIKSDPPWAAWVARLAEYAGGSKAAIIDQALAEYARKARFPETPPPRFDPQPKK